MSITYTPTTNFSSKDSLPANDPAKVIKGAEFTTEFTAIQSAFALASPSASPTFTGTATFDDVSVTNGLTVGGTTLVVDDTNNRVGIGTASPTNNLTIGLGSFSSPAPNTVGIYGSAAGAVYTAAGHDFITETGGTLYNATNTEHFWRTGSVERMRLDSSGNVGIGTSSPLFPLVVSNGNGGTEFEPGDTVCKMFTYNRTTSQYTDNQMGGKDLIFTTGTTSNTERMRIDASGNVGIGTSSPDELLDVDGDAQIQGNGGTARLYLRDTGTPRDNFVGMDNFDNLVLAADDGNVGTDSSMQFRVDGTERMRIDASGNVGIGTSSPSNVLHVESDAIAKVARFSSSGTSATIGLEPAVSAAGLELYADNNGVAVLDYNTGGGGGASNFRIRNNGTEQLRIDSSGNLLVGTTTPLYTAKHTVYNSGGNIGILGVCQTGTATSIPVMRCYHAAASGTTNARMIEFLAGNTAIVGRIESNGTATDYVTTSDARLKENIQDADSSGSVIDGIKVRQYDWKADGSHQRYGFVAQELDLVYPEAVSKGETEEDTWGVDYSKLVPMLVKEIQDLKAKVEALKNA